MNPGEATARSALDKPLAELTEEDIAQITREDCRRFLKDKGMRRPSWNKAQAIQQVISLKALLEGRPGCDDCPAGGDILRKPRPPPPPASASPPLDSPPSAGSGSASGSGGSQAYRRRDTITPPFSAGDLPCRIPTAGAYPPRPPENGCLSPRVTAEEPAGQMTIFYDGRINVYDGVSADQARAVMELAAGPACFDEPTGHFSPTQPPPVFRLPPGLAASPFARVLSIPATGRMPHHVAHGHGLEGRRTPRETAPEGPTSRKASLRRYLEKRKDRFKGKKILGGSTSSDMEIMCFSQKLRRPNLSDLPNLNDTSFPTLPHPPRSPARRSLVENQTQNKIFIDLNDDGGGD